MMNSISLFIGGFHIMALIHNLGFLRIGVNRELKLSQEAFWKGQIAEADLFVVAQH